MKPRHQLEFDFSGKAEPPGSSEQEGNPAEADPASKKANEAGALPFKPRGKPRWEPPASATPPAPVAPPAPITPPAPVAPPAPITPPAPVALSAPVAPPAPAAPSPQSPPPPAPVLAAPPEPPSGEAPALAPVPFFPPPPAVPDALGIRMVNEYVYCPRLFYYETVEGVFQHNRDTLEGKEAHRRVDTAKPGKLPKAKAKASGAGASSAEAAEQSGDAVPPPAGSQAGSDAESGTAPGEEEESIHARSVELSSPSMHLTAKLDLVEGAVSGTGGNHGQGHGTGGAAMLYTPVEYKKGRPREDDDGRALWDADKVQLILQILLLRENGYPSEEGIVYYRETRQRVTLRPTQEDTDWARRMAAEAHATRRKASMPPPLDHSPKCPRCSLAGICLPDETRLMALSQGGNEQVHAVQPASQLDLGLHFGAAPPPHHTSAATAASTRLALMDYVLSQPAPGIRRVKVDPDLRRLIAPNPETRALYLNTPGAWVGKKGETVTVKEKEKLIGEFLLKDLHHVALFGPVQISTGLVQSLCLDEIPLTYFSTGGWFFGITRGHTMKNVLTRIEQFRAAGDPLASLQLARRLIHGKIVNQRTLLMRNHLEPPRGVLHSLKYFAHAALMATGLPQLLGVEGHAAALYFSSFGGMLKPKTASASAAAAPAANRPGRAGAPGSQAGAEAEAEAADPDALTDHRRSSATGSSGTEGPALFPFYPDSRNRRPPRDPVNALLSLTYSLLAKECTLACYAVGLDPYVGVLHQPRHGRPALALDLMEEFRPLLADSTVITLINNGMLTERDFVISSHAAGLTPAGRKTVLNAWERRLADPVTHPLFGYKVSYRRAVELQTRLFAKSLTGEIPEYIPFMTR